MGALTNRKSSQSSVLLSVAIAYDVAPPATSGAFSENTKGMSGEEQLLLHGISWKIVFPSSRRMFFSAQERHLQ